MSTVLRFFDVRDQALLPAVGTFRAQRQRRLGRARRLLCVIAAAVLGLVAAACEVGAEVTIQVEEDGSGLVSVGVGLDVPTANALGGEDEARGYERLVNLDDLKDAGWSYDGLTREVDNLYWLRASKSFGNPEELAAVLAEAAGGGVFSDIELERESTFARQKWSLSGEVNAVAAVLNAVNAGPEAASVGGGGLSGLFDFVRTLESFDISGAAGEDAVAALVETMSFRLEVLLPGDPSENSGPNVIELDDSGDGKASIRVLSEADNSTARTIRYLAYAAAALFVVTVLLSIMKWGYVRRKQKLSSKALLRKAAKEERRAKRAARARKRAEARDAAPTVELKEEEFVSFADPRDASLEQAADDYAYAPVDSHAEYQADDAEYQADDGVKAGVDADADDEESFDAEAVPAGTVPADLKWADGSLTPSDAAVPPDVVSQPSPSRQLRLLCVGVWEILLQPPDPPRELLTAFARQMGSTTDESVIAAAYREAVLGRTTPESLWSDCGLDGQANWPAGGPAAQNVSVRPGAKEFLERVVSGGIYTAGVADGVGGWIRQLLRAQKVGNLHTLLISGELRLSETEPEFLRMLETSTGIPAANCLLIHTRVEVLNAAASLGMSTAFFGAEEAASGHPHLDDFSGLGAVS